jgi:predicted ATPase/DNA-binding SARP family transcriptional activator
VPSTEGAGVTFAEPWLRVLGTVSVGATGDVAISPRLRRLLACLLVDAGSVVPVDRLADILWGDAPPLNIENAVQSLVSRLRTTLRVAGAGDATEVVLTRSPGYVLSTPTDAVDAGRFARLAQAARDAPPEHAVALLDHALELWRGPAYAEFASEPFARAEAARLEELHATARSDRAEALITLGRHDDAVTALEALTTAHPLHERPHALLMRALHHSGRTPDALAVFRRLRATLDEELGIEPSPDLQRLHTQLLRRDVALDLPAAVVPATPPAARGVAGRTPRRSRAPAVPAGNLPAALTGLIGRDEALTAIVDLLAASRIVTLTGPGGVGKTSLALAVARQVATTLRDGGWVFELASIRRADEVVDLLTTTLDIPQQEAASPLERLITVLRPMQALLLLDNCEHLLEDTATLVTAVVQACPDITVLATSREPLRIIGEHVWPVPALAVDAGERTSGAGTSPAARLFAERARAAAPAFTVTPDNAAAIDDLCRRLDGLPLAIELAAMRMPAMTVAEMVERLPARLLLLRSNSRLVQERHRTLRAVVDWSYDTLDDDEQRLFETVAVFAGSFTAAAAEQVAQHAGLDPAATFDVLARLVDKSLIIARTGAPATRYRLLETLRDYGLRRLEERGALAQARAAHAIHWVRFTEQMSARVFTHDQNEAVDAIARELAELRSAHAWALDHDVDLALRMMPALIGYALLRMPAELTAWAQRTLAVAERHGLRTPEVAATHVLIAAGARVSGSLPAAHQHIEAALRYTVEAAPFAHLHALSLLSDVSLFEGRLADVHEIEQRSRDLPASADQRWATSQFRLNHALAHAYAGDTEAALAVADAMRAAVHDDDAPVFAAYPSYAAGEALMERDPARASEAIEHALSLTRDGRDRLALGVTLVSAASLRLRLDDPAGALELFREVVAHWRQQGLRMLLWTTLRNVVALLSSMDATVDAAVLLGVVTSRDSAAPLYGADRERLDTVATVLRTRLGEHDFTRHRDSGARMTDDEAMRFVAGALARADA